jgi:hypothetical protein
VCAVHVCVLLSATACPPKHTPTTPTQHDEATQLSAERLESQLSKVKKTIEEDKSEQMETPYALIIDGKALLYALSPRLRQLFLEVRVCCGCCGCCVCCVGAWCGAVHAT